MANKQALRDLQTRLAERMQQVRVEKPGVSWLAVDCAGQGLLFALRQAGEIFKLGAVLPVPHTQPWLAGVVNLRGGVCTVVDLAAFLGLRQAGGLGGAAQPRLVSFNSALEVNGALLVDRLEGLRHAVDMRAEPEPATEGSDASTAESKHESTDNGPAGVAGLAPQTPTGTVGEVPRKLAKPAKPAFALARWRDAAGRIWQEIDLAELARQPQFLAVTG